MINYNNIVSNKDIYRIYKCYNQEHFYILFLNKNLKVKYYKIHVTDNDAYIKIRNEILDNNLNDLFKIAYMGDRLNEVNTQFTIQLNGRYKILMCASNNYVFNIYTKFISEHKEFENIPPLIPFTLGKNYQKKNNKERILYRVTNGNNIEKLDLVDFRTNKSFVNLNFANLRFAVKINFAECIEYVKTIEEAQHNIKYNMYNTYNTYLKIIRDVELFSKMYLYNITFLNTLS